MVGTPREGDGLLEVGGAHGSQTRAAQRPACVVQVQHHVSLQRTAPTVDPARRCASRKMFFNSVQMTPYRHVTRGFFCPARFACRFRASKKANAATRRRGMAAAVGAASLDGVVHADAVVVPRRLPRQGGSEPEILEGICGSSAGADAGEVLGCGRPARSRGCPDASSSACALDASTAARWPWPVSVTPGRRASQTRRIGRGRRRCASTWSLSSMSSDDEVPVADAVIPRLTLASVAEAKPFRVDVGQEPLLVEFEINGTRALAVGPTSPLAGIVRAGDVLVGVNGRAVSGASLMKVLYVEYRRRRRRRLEWRRAAPRGRYAVDAPPGG